MPYDYLLTTGTVVPDTAELRAQVQAEWMAALGDDLTLDDETPQGVLISAEVEARAASARNNAALANQINPDLAGGIYLDALCGLSGIYRRPAQRTRISDVLLFGVPSTFIPAGVKARTSAGDLFESESGVTLSPVGLARATFLAVEIGPKPAHVGSLVQIVDAVLGWESVNNLSEGIIGSVEQSDESLRNLRRATLARHSMSVSEAVTSDVQSVPGVRSLSFRENVGPAPAVIDGIQMAAHSVWVCVDGGDDEEIAKALLGAKTAGAEWSGEVGVNVRDIYSGQTYIVKFDRPSVFNTLCRVTVRRGAFVGDIQTAVREAIIAYANGDIPGDSGFVVGSAVSPFELGGAVTRQVLGVHVAKVEVSPVSGPTSYQTTEIALAINQVARIVFSSVTVLEI